jgi:pSer/pThr/pTyr-binding forkhead associated (FHA) protein
VWAGDSLSIGRDKTNDLILKDPRVSTHHARVVRREDSYFIEDLGSRNGTFVNGQRVTQQHLQGDEQIQIGHTRLVFEIPRGQEVTP